MTEKQIAAKKARIARLLAQTLGDIDTLAHEVPLSEASFFARTGSEVAHALQTVRDLS
jgi:hypothetical protein